MTPPAPISTTPLSAHYQPPPSHTIAALESLVLTGPFKLCHLTRTLYLPIPHPILKLSLTFPNAADVDPLVATLNDRQVAMQLVGPPYPYSEELARGWIEMNRMKYERVVSQWIEEGRVGATTEGCPVGNIRLGEGAIGEWVGDLGLTRTNYDWIEDVDERNRLVKENEEREFEDPELIWSFGFFLHPKYHRQGIMSAALDALLSSYLFPVLHAQKIHSSAFAGNWGSRRTQEKCGMRVVEGGDYELEISGSRGGGRRKLWHFEYEAARP